MEGLWEGKGRGLGIRTMSPTCHITGNKSSFPRTHGSPSFSFPLQLTSLCGDHHPKSNCFQTQFSKVSLILHHSGKWNLFLPIPRPPSKLSETGQDPSLILPSSFSSSSFISPLLSKPAPHSSHPGSLLRLVS